MNTNVDFRILLEGLFHGKGGGVAEFPMHKLSLILDRLVTLLEDTQRVVHEPAARSALETLAAGKKSVSRDKASVALARSLSVDQPLAWAPAIATLAAE